uniref:Secreted protein n=1 Tax=Panagrellus redivivus TaxID=6233 RepID=A0A7E4UVD6_PANRE
MFILLVAMVTSLVTHLHENRTLSVVCSVSLSLIPSLRNDVFRVCVKLCNVTPTNQRRPVQRHSPQRILVRTRPPSPPAAAASGSAPPASPVCFRHRVAFILPLAFLGVRLCNLGLFWGLHHWTRALPLTAFSRAKFIRRFVLSARQRANLLFAVTMSQLDTCASTTMDAIDQNCVFTWAAATPAAVAKFDLEQPIPEPRRPEGSSGLRTHRFHTRVPYTIGSTNFTITLQGENCCC